MTIRKIHVPLIGHYGTEELKTGSEAALRVGLMLGRVFDAHVEVCCIAPIWDDPADQLAAAYPGTAIEKLLGEIQKQSRKDFWLTRSLFDRIAVEFRPATATTPDRAPAFSAEFLEIVGEIDSVAAEHGKLADLSVIASPPNIQLEKHHRLLQALLTDTGRPLMIVPADCPKVEFDNVAIAWNDTDESARAVAMSMDFIRRASEAVIITVLEDGPLSSGPQALAQYLHWHGVRTRVVEVARSGQAVADLLLQQALEAGAGLLVMGAYTRGRLRRVMFGGATGGVLTNASLPLLLID